MSDRVKIGGGLLVVVALIVLFVALKGGGSSDDNGFTINGKTVASDSTPTIKLHNGEPAGGVEQMQAGAGDRIHFRVTSDRAGEVHVHGYNFLKPIKKNGSVSFDFPAKLEGGYDIELHHGGGENTIADLKVEPN